LLDVLQLTPPPPNSEQSQLGTAFDVAIKIHFVVVYDEYNM
jgi:hypothetical protein